MMKKTIKETKNDMVFYQDQWKVQLFDLEVHSYVSYMLTIIIMLSFIFSLYTHSLLLRHIARISV